MKSLIDVTDLSVSETKELMDTAKDIIENPSKYCEACKGKKLATLFFEPSTRTRLSFEAAMLELGGSVIGVSSAENCSASKGESVADTAKVLSCYADIIAMRHPKEGAPLVAALNATVPVINAGDGGHKHPTQTLTDLFTIINEKGRLNNLTVGFCGDLKYGRTVHSLITALSRYEGIKLVLISPSELKIPTYVKKDFIERCGMEYTETQDLESALGSLDVLYMTRIQRERFSDGNEYERLKNVYVLDEEKMKKAKSDMIVMHPLPRVNEISVGVDSDKRACYFKQVFNGKIIRMALILKLLKDSENKTAFSAEGKVYEEYRCANSRCITSVEQELEHRFAPSRNGGEVLRCIYCDKKAVKKN